MYMEDDKDVTDIPYLPEETLRKLLRGNMSGLSLFGGGPNQDCRELAIAEMTRRQTNAQTRLMRGQEQQLEAQGKQLEAQRKQIEVQTTVARSLRNATWVLAAATVLLAIATLVPWIWPRKPEAAPRQSVRLHISPPPIDILPR